MFKRIISKRYVWLRIELNLNFQIPSQWREPTWAEVATRAAWNVLTVIALLLAQ
jgi:hypothetical protein